MTLRRFRARVWRQRSRHMVNGHSFVDDLAVPRIDTARSAASSVASTRAGMPAKPSRRSIKSATAISLAALSTVAPPAGRERPAGRRQRWEPDRGRAPRRSGSRFWRDRAAQPDRRCESGQARQCAIGMRISGEPSCATTEPSRNSTMPWTMDCGCTNTSSPVRPHGEQVMGLDQLQAFVQHGCRIDGDLRAHRPVGMLEGLFDASPPASLLASRCGTVRRRR